MRTAHTPRRRSGFSLVELLVVLSILAVLVGLSAGAVLQTINAQQRSNSKTLLNKVDGELSKQWTATIDQAKAENPSQAVLQMAGGDPRRAKVIWVKLRLKQEFPMSYAEARLPGGNDVPPAELPSKYATIIGNRPAANNPSTEMAACLLLALKKQRRGSGFNAEEAFGSGAMIDTDGDGLPEIVDGWGTPVGFYRWNGGHSGLDSIGQRRGPLDGDREDPDHLLMNSGWLATPGAAAFERLCHPLRLNGSPYSLYTEPIIVSYGKDKQSGLDPLQFRETNTAQAQDNLYSFQIR